MNDSIVYLSSFICRNVFCATTEKVFAPFANSFEQESAEEAEKRIMEQIIQGHTGT
jgi:hypothetical protein